MANEFPVETPTEAPTAIMTSESVSAPNDLTATTAPTAPTADMGTEPSKKETKRRTHEAKPFRPMPTSGNPEDITAWVNGYAAEDSRLNTGLQKGLLEEPIVRTLDFRPTIRTPKINIKANLMAAIVQQRGDVAPQPCQQCARRTGAFTTCVAMEGQLGEACASCFYNRQGPECEFSKAGKYSDSTVCH
jgi:hypothetical protein